MTYTEDEMVRLWLIRKGFEPLRSDCRIERSDGADLAEYARTECRLWYDRLLREAPVEMLVPENLAGDPSIHSSATLTGAVKIVLPERVVRTVAVKLRSWDAPAQITPAGSPLARMQYGGYSAGGPVNPVAVVNPDGSIELYSCTYNDYDAPEYLLCICRELDEEGAPLYTFQPEALSTIDQFSSILPL